MEAVLRQAGLERCMPSCPPHYLSFDALQTPSNVRKHPFLVPLQAAEPAAASTPGTETEEEETLSPDSGGV